jgi:hypothetical protein
MVRFMAIITVLISLSGEFIEAIVNLILDLYRTGQQRACGACVVVFRVHRGGVCPTYPNAQLIYLYIYIKFNE